MARRLLNVNLTPILEQERTIRCDGYILSHEGKFRCSVRSIVAKLAGTALCSAAEFPRSYSVIFISLRLFSRIYFSIHSQAIESGLAYCKLWLWSATHLLCIFLVILKKKNIRTIKRKPISHVRGLIFCLVLGWVSAQIFMILIGLSCVVRTSRAARFPAPLVPSLSVEPTLVFLPWSSTNERFHPE